MLAFLVSATTVALAVLVPWAIPAFGVLRGGGFFDLTIYREAAGVVLNGSSLYAARFGLGLGFAYPPAAAVLFCGLRLVSLRVDEIGVTLLNLALLAVIAHCTLRLLPATDDPAQRTRRSRLAWLAAAAAPWTFPVASAIGFGQIDLLITALVLVDLTTSRESPWNGMLIGLAAGLKLTPLIFIVVLAFSGHRRMAARALGAFALSIALAFDTVPGDARFYWTRGVFGTSRITGGGTGQGSADQSLHGALLRLLGSGPHTTALWPVAGALILAVGLPCAIRACRRGQDGWGFVLTAIIGLLVCPISWPHHWVIALPGLLLLTEAAGRLSGARRRFALLAVATLAAGSWLLKPIIADDPAGRAGSLLGLLGADLYVLVGVTTIVVAATIELVRPARAGRESGSSRSPSPAPHPGPVAFGQAGSTATSPSVLTSPPASTRASSSASW